MCFASSPADRGAEKLIAVKLRIYEYAFMPIHRPSFHTYLLGHDWSSSVQDGGVSLVK